MTDVVIDESAAEMPDGRVWPDRARRRPSTGADDEPDPPRRRDDQSCNRLADTTAQLRKLSES